jgi:heme oxygenase
MIKSRALSTSHLLSDKTQKVNTIWELDQEYKECSNNYSQRNLNYVMELKKIFKESVEENTKNAKAINELIANNSRCMKKKTNDK